MSKVLFATQMQKELLDSQERVTVITAEPCGNSSIHR